MTTNATVTRDSGRLDHSATLVEEHDDVWRGVQNRASAVNALVATRVWPHSELATLTGYLRATLLRQASDEERLLYPNDATAGPFADLSAAHARLHELTQELEEIRERRAPLPRLRQLVEELLSTLRRHLAEERAVLAALSVTDAEVPAAAALVERHQRWSAAPDEGPLVIEFDALPAAVATQLCVERILRLQPGERAVVHARDRAQVHDLRAWLHSFDPERFALATATERDGGTRLDVSCRDASGNT